MYAAVGSIPMGESEISNPDRLVFDFQWIVFFFN